MKNLIKIFILLSVSYAGAQAQPMSVTICGCPQLVMENSGNAYLQFESHCNISDYDDPAIIFSNGEYIVSDQLGQWMVANAQYRTAYTQLEEFIPYDVNNFTLYFGDYYCTYLNGEIVNDNLTVPTYTVVEENIIFNVYTIEGKYIGDMDKKAVFDLPRSIYILKNWEKRLLFKIHN